MLKIDDKTGIVMFDTEWQQKRNYSKALLKANNDPYVQ